MRPGRTALTAVAAVGAAALGGALIALPASANGERAHAGFRIIQGTVTGFTADGFSVINRSGSHDVMTGPDTTYSESGDPSAPSGVSVGQLVAVKVARWAAAPASSSELSSSGSSSTDSSSNGSSSTGSSSNGSSSTGARYEPVATHVSIILDSVSGVVSGLDGSTATISGPWGGSTTVLLSSAQVFSYVRGADGTKSAVGSSLADNDIVTAFGEPDSTTPSELDAYFVRVWGAVPADSTAASTPPATPIVVTAAVSTPATPGYPPRTVAYDRLADSSPAAGTTWVKGTVASVSGDDIVINQPDGSQVTVVASSSTKYRSMDCNGYGSESAGLSGINPKDRIAAVVTPADGVLNADQIDYAPPASDGGYGHYSSNPYDGQAAYPGNNGSPNGAASESGYRYGQQHPQSGGSGYGAGRGDGHGGGGAYGGGRGSRH